MDFDLSSLEGESQFQVYMKAQQVSNDTDPLMWWKQHQQNTWQYLPLLCLLRDSSVVWDLYRLTCAEAFWTPRLTWCGLNNHLKSFWKRSRKGHTHTHTNTHTTYSLTDSPIHIHTSPCVSHTNTLELLLHLQHLIPCPSLPTINHVDKRSLLITVLLMSTGFDNV